MNLNLASVVEMQHPNLKKMTIIHISAIIDTSFNDTRTFKMAKKTLTTNRVNDAYDTLVLLRDTATPEQRALLKQVRDMLAQHKLFKPL